MLTLENEKPKKTGEIDKKDYTPKGSPKDLLRKPKAPAKETLGKIRNLKPLS